MKLSNDLLHPEIIINPHSERSGIITGNRVPKDYFVTKGHGESDITIHSGSFHLALKAAGIEMGNIMTYSSILPGIANEVPKPKHITHGCVIETIMAVAHGEKGEELSAGIIYGWLYDRESRNKYGGLVCEHDGKYTEKAISETLSASLQELYTNGFEEQYELRDISLVTDSIIPQKKYGSVLTALCFTSYYHPVIA